MDNWEETNPTNQTDSMEKKTSQEREEISIIFNTARKVLEQRV